MSNFNSPNNNFNFNNNSDNAKFQFITHENLFNKNLNNIPQFNFEEPKNFQINQNIHYNFNKKMEPDYSKRFKDEKFKEISSNQRNIRFMKNYENKIKEIQNNKNIFDNNSNNEEIFIDEYIRQIKELYKDRNNYYNYIQQNGFYNFSKCPFCGGPAIYAFERVLCIDRCFMTTVANNTFDESYTLDNFIEQYKDYYSNHLNCKENLMTLYVDKESKCAEFLCFKCERNYINF